VKTLQSLERHEHVGPTAGAGTMADCPPGAWFAFNSMDNWPFPKRASGMAPYNSWIEERSGLGRARAQARLRSDLWTPDALEVPQHERPLLAGRQLLGVSP
jgi:hypothetical protein